MTDRPLAIRAGDKAARRRRDLAAPGGPGEARRWPAWRARGAVLAGRHWLFCLLLAAGLVLRILAQLAYQPALVYVDTLKYLYGVYPGSDPLGYDVPLKIILAFGNLETVALVQHLLGLAMAAALYAILLRRGVSRWLAALAAAPVLLDAYQLQMESMIMPDVWFEAIVVAGLVVLLWRAAVSVPFAVAAGLLLGSSATVRQIGELLVFPALLYLLAAGGGWRRAMTRSAALVVAFALPILCYCSVSYIRNHHFRLANGQSFVGRTVGAADCATLKVPRDVKALCPAPPVQANGPDWLEHSGKSPIYSVGPKQGRPARRDALVSAIRHQQPLLIAGAILRDSVRLFALTRDGVQSVTPIARWQFQDHYPAYPKWINVRDRHVILGIQRFAFGKFRFRALPPSYGGPVHVSRPLAGFLRSYQLDGGYTPGPLFALFALAALAGSALILLRRRPAQAGTGQSRGRGLAVACLLFTAAAFVVLALPDVYEFSWRYELPAVILLPPAGVLGISAVLRYRRARGGPAASA